MDVTKIVTESGVTEKNRGIRGAEISGRVGLVKINQSLNREREEIGGSRSALQLVVCVKA